MKTRILLIDDEPFNLRLLIEFLQEREFSITIAQNGKEGLRLATHTQPELILLDIRMSDMDGLSVYQQLLTNPKTSNTIVIFLSAIDDINYKEYALNLGGADYIVKPINARELIARIQSHLKRQRQYQKALTLLENCKQHKEFNNTSDIDNENKMQIITQYLLKNLHVTPSLNELAQIANTNRTTINIQFRNSLGMSIFEWLGEQRLLKAAILLRSSTILIQNIAVVVGYANTSALTHAFKRRFGYTPSEYRLLEDNHINSN